MYRLIFHCVGSRGQLEQICLVLGILYFRSKGPGFFSLDTTIEDLLDLKAGGLVLLLQPILSLVAIDGDNNIRIFHKSLMAYLLDSTRSGYLPFDLARVHEAAATYILKQRILKDLCCAFVFHRYTPTTDFPPSSKLRMIFDFLLFIADMPISMIP
jgi:hypothetical protein